MYPLEMIAFLFGIDVMKMLCTITRQFYASACLYLLDLLTGSVSVSIPLLRQVKSDRLPLEDQLANFQSLQTASQTAADYGRRMVSLSLASEILKQNAELEKSAGELKKKLTAAVVPAPTYQVGWMSVL